jgi:multidrug efflux system outer membrane protein
MRTPVSILVVLLTLGGCMVGPDYRRPSIDTPNAFRFEDKEAKEVVNTDWWQQFQDPVLNDLIGVALAENKDVKIAAARVEEFLGRLGTTRSQLFPQAGVGTVSQRQRASALGVTPVPSGSDSIFNYYEATLSASWEIDVFGKLRRQTEAARASLLASEEGRRATILTLVTSVASSYVNLRDLDRQLAIARATAASRKESLTVFEQRFAGGTISELELAQNLSEYEAAAATIPQLELQVAQQENALSVLLGRNPGPIPRGRELEQLQLPPVPAGLPSQLLERRPDLRQSEQNLIAANANIGAARALYFPTISLTGFFGSISTSMANLFTGPSRAWAYAGNTSMPVFTAGGIAGQVRAAKALQQQALLGYQKTIQTAFQEVEDSLASLQKSREQLAAQGRQVEALRTYARLARVRYDNGYTSYIEVLDAERSLFNVEVSYTQTQGVVFTSLVNLYKAMGGGWVVNAERLTARESAPTAAR